MLGLGTKEKYKLHYSHYVQMIKYNLEVYGSLFFMEKRPSGKGSEHFLRFFKKNRINLKGKMAQSLDMIEFLNTQKFDNSTLLCGRLFLA